MQGLIHATLQNVCALQLDTGQTVLCELDQLHCIIIQGASVLGDQHSAWTYKLIGHNRVWFRIKRCDCPQRPVHYQSKVDAFDQTYMYSMSSQNRLLLLLSFSDQGIMLSMISCLADKVLQLSILYYAGCIAMLSITLVYLKEYASFLANLLIFLLPSS